MISPNVLGLAGHQEPRRPEEGPLTSLVVVLSVFILRVVILRFFQWCYSAKYAAGPDLKSNYTCSMQRHEVMLGGAAEELEEEKKTRQRARIAPNTD